MQCLNCTNYHKEMMSYGQYEPAECEHTNKIIEVMEDGEAAEVIAAALSALAFKLSDLNNCPFFEDKYKKQRQQSIIDLALS